MGIIYSRIVTNWTFMIQIQLERVTTGSKFEFVCCEEPKKTDTEREGCQRG